jgi:hypothetical protein
MNIKPGFYYNNSTRTFEIGSVILGPTTRIHSENPEFAKIDARTFGLLIHEEKLLATLKERFSDASEYVFTPAIVEEPIIEPVKDLEPLKEVEPIIEPVKDLEPLKEVEPIIEPVKDLEPETPPQVNIVEIEEPKVKKSIKPKK